jgi:hypothetical protein
MLENPLAQRLLAGEFHPGDTIHVGAPGDDGGNLVFTRRVAAEA